MRLAALLLAFLSGCALAPAVFGEPSRSYSHCCTDAEGYTRCGAACAPVRPPEAIQADQIADCIRATVPGDCIGRDSCCRRYPLGIDQHEDVRSCCTPEGKGLP